MDNDIFRKTIKLKDGNSLDIFFNKKTNLLVVDKVRKDGKGGNEFIRYDVSTVKLPTTRQLRKVV